MAGTNTFIETVPAYRQRPSCYLLDTTVDLCFREPLLCCLPVDNIPDSAEVLSLSVLVLEIVSMLPSVNTKQRLVLANDRVLVGICLDANVASLCVLDEPCPTAALNASKSSVELLLHVIETAISSVDSLGQLAGWRLSTTLVLRCQVLPEKGVVEVTASMEVDQRLNSNLRSNIVTGLGSS